VGLKKVIGEETWKKPRGLYLYYTLKFFFVSAYPLRNVPFSFEIDDHVSLLSMHARSLEALHLTHARIIADNAFGRG